MQKALALCAAAFLMIGSVLPMVAVAQTRNDLVCSIRATPTTAAPGETVRLVWSAIGARTAYIDGLGAVATAGYKDITAAESRDVYLQVRGYSNNHVTCKTRITVSAKKPSCFISITPLAIASDSFATLTWNAQYADSVLISSIGSVPASGSRVVRATQSTKYIMTGRGSGGTCENTTTLSVRDPFAAYGYFPAVTQSITYPVLGTPRYDTHPTVTWSAYDVWYDSDDYDVYDVWYEDPYEYDFDAYEEWPQEEIHIYDELPQADVYIYDSWQDPQLEVWSYEPPTYNESFYQSYYEEPAYNEPFYQGYYEPYYDWNSSGVYDI